MGREAQLIGWWAVLAIATLLSFNTGSAGGSLTARIVVIAITMLKASIVFYQFMDIRSAPKPLQVVIVTWIVAIGAGISAILAGFG